MPLFDSNDPDQRKAAMIAAAGVALHGLLASGFHNGHQDQETINQAFALGNLFIVEAERRLK